VGGGGGGGVGGGGGAILDLLGGDDSRSIHEKLLPPKGDWLPPGWILEVGGNKEKRLSERRGELSHLIRGVQPSRREGRRVLKGGREEGTNYREGKNVPHLERKRRRKKVTRTEGNLRGNMGGEGGNSYQFFLSQEKKKIKKKGRRK